MSEISFVGERAASRRRAAEVWRFARGVFGKLAVVGDEQRSAYSEHLVE